MNKTKKITLCAALVALSVVVLYLGALIEVLDLSVAFIACLGLVLAVIELGFGWAWMVLCGTTLLCALLLPNPYLFPTYAVMGILTLLKSPLERLLGVLQWVCKFLVFNILYLGLLALLYYVFGMPLESGELFGWSIPTVALPVLFLVLGNILYLLCDVTLTRLIALYLRKWSERVRRLLK